MQSRRPKTKIPAVTNVVRIDSSREVLCSHPALVCFGENATHCKRAPTEPTAEYQHWNRQLHTIPTVVMFNTVRSITAIPSTKLWDSSNSTNQSRVVSKCHNLPQRLATPQNSSIRTWVQVFHLHQHRIGHLIE